MAEKKGKNKPKKDLFSIKNQVLKLLTEEKHRGYSVRSIMRALNLKNKQAKQEVSQIIEALLEEGAIFLTDDDRVRSSTANPNTIIGTVDYVNAKYAFIVSPDLEQDVWVDAENLAYALDGDKVKIAVYQPDKKTSRPEGEVIEIVERKREEFVGRIEITAQKFAFVLPDHKKMYFDIFVHPDKTLNAQTGDKVIVKIKDWPRGAKNPVGFVTKVLGKAGEHNTEMHAIMAEYELPMEFPENVMSKAEAISDKITEEEISKRRDFRDVLTFTIDPVDAKDFDDALSIKQLANGNWEIGVHIADVTHYVTPRSVLEKEAYERATSVYLVDRVVPMLPERLSNGLCSLRPHEDKLTFSAVFELDEEAHILNQWFGRTIIHSQRRFSYEEVQQIIEDKKGEYIKEITVLNKLAHKLRAQRFKEGAITFETVEVKFKLDEHGNPIAVYPKERKDAHKLIEDFMLLANKKVAEYIFKLKKGKKDQTMVYRVHEPPDLEKVRTFSNFVKKLGHTVHVENDKIAQSLNKMIESIEGNPEQSFLQNLAVRTMSKAKYSTEEKGHFGLAFPHYTHFTSPIRRYPDMMAHRLLQHYLDGGKPKDLAEYEEKCKHSSEKERKAADAERASIKYKQVEFMKNKINHVYEGIVTGITEWGIYVEIVENKCEGMVRLTDMKDDYYEVDPQNYRIVGKGSQKVITFGDKVMVKIKDANLAKRTIDLYLV